MIKNKVRLVAQGYTQEEDIDYDKVFAPVAKIEAYRLFLTYASFKDFVVYQMDIKSAFIYGKIEEEVYVCQPPGFEDPDFPDRRGKIDKTLFIRRDKGDILLVQVYVDDIIFGSTKKSLCTEFEKMTHKKFQMSSMGELTFFLGLQVKQKEDGIFISQDKYVTEILKKFGFTDVKASTPMETQNPLLKDADVCACARYQVNPKVSHLHAVKRIFRHLKGQPKLGLWLHLIDLRDELSVIFGLSELKGIIVMSIDSAVTYTSVHSEARSWSIPSEDPYEEAARQLLEQASPRFSRGTPSLLPIPLPAPSTSRRADIPEADTPPRKRLLLTTPRPGCEVGESSAAAARQPGPTMAHRVDCSFVDTMETRFRDTERRMMTALEMVNMRVSYQVDVRSRESLEFHSRHHDAQKDRAAVRAEIEVLRRERLAYEQESMETRQALARSEAYCRALEARVTVLETEVHRHEWQRQAL
ncbi:putative ribonuclease H-like domain-containing protein [Tanacetum coccineum]